MPQLPLDLIGAQALRPLDDSMQVYGSYQRPYFNHQHRSNLVRV